MVDYCKQEIIALMQFNQKVDICYIDDLRWSWNY